MEDDLEVVGNALKEVLALGRKFRSLESRWEYLSLENDARAAKETLFTLSRSITAMLTEVVRRMGDS